ncbi:ATP-binding cassette domain-containing protein, partial [Clostridium perfringens]
MSILKVTNMSQGFGDRQIFNDVSFNLLNGEHIGLVGANGEGKTTFLKLITNEILPDQGTIEWNRKVSVGYMDQNVKLRDEDTVRMYLRTAFTELFNIEKNLNKIYENMSTMAREEMEKALNKIGVLQETLEKGEFYSIESK